MRRFLSLLCVLFLFGTISLAAINEFDAPWKNSNVAIVIDPFEGNPIDWEQLSTDKRVTAIIHRATIGYRVDKKYFERRNEAKTRGYKWGSYHLGKPGDPIKQANFYLKTIDSPKDEILALDIESPDPNESMSLDDARIFISYIKEKTGRYPLLYGNRLVINAITEQYGMDEVFSKTPLWYARYKAAVTDFPVGTWESYTFWQFSCEINCKAKELENCLYLVPGTKSDMDINVYNGSVDDLRKNWDLIGK
ncbi:MAG: glycoside hydrolase family 25 protein [Acidobacteria bacterium]|nr:glycoside hydrolase family 25 protein [Acidobacteriota bacterium]